MFNKKVIIDSLRNLNKPSKTTNRNSFDFNEPDRTEEGFISAQEGVETPIYKAVRVGPSPIEGKGLFAEQAIKKGEVIGVSHIRQNFTKNGEEYRAPFPSTVLGYYNHSEEPNVYEVDKGDHILMVAGRDIPRGQEITSNYSKHNIEDLETPEDFKKGGATKRPKMPKGKSPRSYSRSFEATNKLFTEHPFFSKPKSRKNKIFDPRAQYYANGGLTQYEPGGVSADPPDWLSKKGANVYFNPTYMNNFTGGTNSLERNMLGSYRTGFSPVVGIEGSLSKNRRADSEGGRGWLYNAYAGLNPEAMKEGNYIPSAGLNFDFENSPQDRVFRPFAQIGADYNPDTGLNVGATSGARFAFTPYGNKRIKPGYATGHLDIYGGVRGGLGEVQEGWNSPTGGVTYGARVHGKYMPDKKSVLGKLMGKGAYFYGDAGIQFDPQKGQIGQKVQDYTYTTGAVDDSGNAVPATTVKTQDSGLKFGNTIYANVGVKKELDDIKFKKDDRARKIQEIEDNEKRAFQENEIKEIKETKEKKKNDCPPGYIKDCRRCPCYREKLRHPRWLEEGGISVELTREDIDKYVKGGYIVEELSKARNGLEVKEIKPIKDTSVPSWKSKLFNRAVIPMGYDMFTVLSAPLEAITPKALKYKPKEFATKNRLDAFRVYNGLEPEFDTFTTNPDGTLAANHFRLAKEDFKKIIDHPKKSFGTTEIADNFNFAGIHGNGWITKGVDNQGRKFIDFTDTWDLNPLRGKKWLPKQVRDFEVSSVTGSKPYDLKNRIYYDDAGNFFDHNGNKLIEEIQHFPKGVVNEHKAVDLPMLSTSDVVGTNQMDVLKDWNNINNHKFFKGGLGALGLTMWGLNNLNKYLKEEEEVDKESINEDIEIDIPEDEIQKYVDGGYVVEELPKANRGLYVKEKKTYVAPKIHEVEFKPAEIQTYNPSLKEYQIYNVELPDRIVPGREYADVKHKMANLRKDLGISTLDHMINKYVPGAAHPISLMKDSGIVIDPMSGQLFDSNTRYWLNREYGFEPNINELLFPLSSTIARDYGTLKMSSDTPFENRKMGINYMDELANPYTQKNGLLDLFGQPTGGPLMIGMGMMGKPEFTKEIKNPDYFTQLLNTYDTKRLSYSSRKYYQDLINSVKNQNGLATERQFNELQRLKTGDFNFGKRGYAKGGLVKFVSGGDNDCPEGYIKDENGNCIPANYDPNVANENTEFLKSMANSPLFVERYARMVGKPLEEVTQEAEDYRKQILQNLETVQMGDSAYPPQSFGKDVGGYYFHNPMLNEYSQKLNEVQTLMNNIPNKGKYNKELKARYQSIYDDAKKEYDDKLKTTHKIYFKKWNKPYDLHERSHASVEGELKVANPYKFKDLSEIPHIQKLVFETMYPTDNQEYYESPNEIKSAKDVAAETMMRLGLYDPINENFTPEHYKKLIELKRNNSLDPETEGQIDRITTPFTEEETIRMFNDIVQNDNDQDLQYAKYGGQFELGDEVDEATMKQLMKLGYTFEKI